MGYGGAGSGGYQTPMSARGRSPSQSPGGYAGSPMGSPGYGGGGSNIKKCIGIRLVMEGEGVI
jgi:hypothetical protein